MQYFIPIKFGYHGNTVLLPPQSRSQVTGRRNCRSKVCVTRSHSLPLLCDQVNLQQDFCGLRCPADSATHFRPKRLSELEFPARRSDDMSMSLRSLNLRIFSRSSIVPAALSQVTLIHRCSVVSEVLVTVTRCVVVVVKVQYTCDYVCQLL